MIDLSGYLAHGVSVSEFIASYPSKETAAAALLGYIEEVNEQAEFEGYDVDEDVSDLTISEVKIWLTANQ